MDRLWASLRCGEYVNVREHDDDDRVYCKCLGITWNVECGRRATEEDGLCDECRKFDCMNAQDEESVNLRAVMAKGQDYAEGWRDDLPSFE